MSVPDIKKKKIPVWMLIVTASLTILMAVLSVIGNTGWLVKLVGMAAGLLPGAALILLGKITGKVGLADGIILSVIGALEGYMGAIAVLAVSCFIMSIPAMILLALKKVRKETAMAFVPYICVGYLIWIIMLG
jgi:prepilin signal peptidase PulO-like enzyme (type II secretory pathway)